MTQRTETSLRRLRDVLKRLRRLTTKPDVLTTPGRRRLIYDVLKSSDLRRLQNVRFTSSCWFATSWRHQIHDVLEKSVYNVLKTFCLWSFGGRLIYHVLKTSNFRRLKDIEFTSSWRRLICDVLRTSVLRRLEDVWFATS